MYSGGFDRRGALHVFDHIESEDPARGLREDQTCRANCCNGYQNDPDIPRPRAHRTDRDRSVTATTKVMSYTDALSLFMAMVRTDPGGAAAYVTNRGAIVRDKARDVQRADATTREQVTVFTLSVWQVALEGLLKAALRDDVFELLAAEHKAGTVANHLNDCLSAVALEDTAGALEALQAAESMF